LCIDMNELVILALIATGAIVWILIGVTAALWLPLLPAFTIGWICYKSQRFLSVRDSMINFAAWYADHVLKPVFDPILWGNTYT